MLNSDLVEDNNSVIGFGAYRTRNYTQFETISCHISTRKQVNNVSPLVEKIYDEQFSGGLQLQKAARASSKSVVPQMTPQINVKVYQTVKQENQMMARHKLKVQMYSKLDKVLNQHTVNKQISLSFEQMQTKFSPKKPIIKLVPKLSQVFDIERDCQVTDLLEKFRSLPKVKTPIFTIYEAPHPKPIIPVV